MAHSLRADSPSWWQKALQQEHEAAGHAASTARKQRETDTGVKFTFSFLFSLRDGPAHIQGETSLLS